MHAAVISASMCIVRFQLPVPTGSMGRGGSPTPPAARQAGGDDRRRARPKAPFPVLLINIKAASRHPSALHCSAKASSRLNSSSDSGSSFLSFPSPVTFPLSKSSAMKGHIDSWGHYLVEGTFS